jgi:hypothetical protein
MTERKQQLDATLAALRADFDAAFAKAPASTAAPAEELLAIRVQAEPFAVPVAEVAGLCADRLVVPLPTPARELLGLVCLRGRVVPVYDLAALLMGGSPRPPPRWMLLVRGHAALGLAFDVFEGQLMRGGARRPLVDLGELARQLHAKCAPLRRYETKGAMT